jgi:hypothetical protein
MVPLPWGVAWPAQQIPTAVNLVFLDHSRYFFIQEAGELHSHFSSHLVAQGIEPGNSGFEARNSDN